VKDSIYTEESADFQNNTVSQYEDEKNQQQQKLLNQEIVLQQQRLQNNRIIIFAISFGLLLLLVLSIVILRGYRQKQKTNKLLELKNAEIEKKNKDITDSIKYAQRIQRAILPSSDFVKKYLPEYFFVYVPKDIVSGDFYWVEHKENKTLFSAVDCTGHGVPGAFMSIVGRNLLNQAVNEYNITKPSEILNYLNNGVIETFKHSQGQNDRNNDVKDGMDLALCCLSDDFSKLEYAGAYNPLYLIRNNEVIHYKADVYPIGTPFSEKLKTFTNYEINLNKGDTIYIFSDGYVDQFGGGLNRKKFSSKRFRETLIEIQPFSMAEQKKKLIKIFEEWKGPISQLDDVLIIGIRV
jgi:serine phosphatase RsbU (regulator of sigma subunit)